MAIEVLLVRDKNRLAAANPLSEETIERMKQGEVVAATIRRTRNPGHHRKFFALLQAVYENQTRYPTLEGLLDAIKIGTGHYRVTEALNGDFVYQPLSISYGKMDQTAFEQFYDCVVELVLHYLLPEIQRADLDRRVNDILDGRP